MQPYSGALSGAKILAHAVEHIGGEKEMKRQQCRKAESKGSALWSRPGRRQACSTTTRLEREGKR
ncbi:hypothetical protein F2Q68_00035156 [Brassica cretica]|uniref:Uncharacterized protein n=1 Tax=Brassica cretica TaxID=69181 RepID=A0A8S9H6M7_BRACR|nr:hypothetical protein F2Q68_00035156 [Brassica cretica]